ncbi:MAG TPA: DUF2087 domain-containing protein [Acidimicrobiales bacterium]|nr:DUF2087 domain-containing protein [Acidimicrobiales bacterium]
MRSLAATVLGMLSDDDRLRVVAALALDASHPAEVAARAGMDVRRTGRALARLTSAGLVEQDRGGYRLVRERFRQALEAIPPGEPTPVLESGLGREADRVLATFLDNGKLSSIPVNRTKRLIVLDYLAGRFELGEVFTEKDVNEMLRELHPDVAALRRYLVDEGFLGRRDGFYWRTGGTVTV